jgi:hypothetical protein
VRTRTAHILIEQCVCVSNGGKHQFRTLSKQQLRVATSSLHSCSACATAVVAGCSRLRKWPRTHTHTHTACPVYTRPHTRRIFLPPCVVRALLSGAVVLVCYNASTTARCIDSHKRHDWPVTANRGAMSTDASRYYYLRLMVKPKQPNKQDEPNQPKFVRWAPTTDLFSTSIDEAPELEVLVLRVPNPVPFNSPPRVTLPHILDFSHKRCVSCALSARRSKCAIK